MAKIHPDRSASTRSNSSRSSSERETFTVWMKSLVFNGNGCTVFNSRGEVIFRVDNYQKKSSSKVFLMDSSGKTLFSIYRKKLRMFSRWEGFKCSKGDTCKGGFCSEGFMKPCFSVKRIHKIFSRDISCRVILKCDENRTSYCRIMGLEGKSSFKIIDLSGQLLAEGMQKQSSEGVPLGKDVLSLNVEAHADQSLIMALVTIYALISNKL